MELAQYQYLTPTTRHDSGTTSNQRGGR
ncbi:hypothetical protein [Duncaniella dubosii]